MRSKYFKFGILSLSICAITQVNAQTSEKTQKSPEQIFAKADVNSDSVIDMNEFTIMANKRSEGKHDPVKVSQKFAKVDANSDGQISQEEFVAMHEKRKAKKTENKNGY